MCYFFELRWFTFQGENSLYINGSDQHGEARLVVRVAIKPDDQREVGFLLRLPDVGDLVLPGNPDCTVDNVRPGEGFSGAGLSCAPIEPLRIWRISYNGLCRFVSYLAILIMSITGGLIQINILWSCQQLLNIVV